MAIINTIVLVLALAWIAIALLGLYAQRHIEGTVSLMPFALLMTFTPGMVALLLLGFAPVHLLWWFFLNPLLTALLIGKSPTWVKFNVRCLALLVGSARISIQDRPKQSETPHDRAITAGAKFHRGQKVKVVSGTKDPDYGFPIGGWTGTIEKLFMDQPDEVFYEIRWDRRTRRLIGRSIRKKCERDDLDPDLMTLGENELKPGEPKRAECNSAIPGRPGETRRSQGLRG